MTDLVSLHLEYFLIFMNPLSDTNSFCFMAMDSSKIRPSSVLHGRTLPLSPLSPVICHQCVIFWCIPPPPKGDDMIYVQPLI